MQDLLEFLVHEGQLTPAQRAALERNPAQRDELQQWLQVRAGLKGRLDQVVPDRQAFVLHALARAGHFEELTAAERQQVEASKEAMGRAMEVYPALRDIAGRIEEDRAEFAACWEQPVRIRRLTPRVWRMAAVIVMLIGFAAIFALFLGQDLHTVAVSDGETHQLELPDGSTVLLVDDAEVRYDAEDFARHVRFSGSAFFDVAHSEEPFTIATPGAVTTVLGTRFGIKASGEVTAVILERGRVSLAAHDSPEAQVILSPGEMSNVLRGGLPSAPTSVDLMSALGWTGYLFFDATPMVEVARVLQDRYSVDISVVEALQQEQVSGSFEPTDAPAHILSVIATTLDAEVVGSESTGFRIR